MAEAGSIRRLAELASAFVNDRRRRHVLGITGSPGAGKSTVASQIVAELGRESAVSVAMDGFHLADPILTAHGTLDRKGAIETFDDEGYASLVERLAAAKDGDRPVYAPAFRRATEEAVAGALEVPSEVPLVVTEGNYLLSAEGAWPSARRHMTEVWFIRIPQQLRLDRLIARHESHGRSRAEATAWAFDVDERNAQAVEALAERADRVFDLEGERRPLSPRVSRGRLPESRRGQREGWPG